MSSVVSCRLVTCEIGTETKMDFFFFALVQNRQHSAVLIDFAPSTWFLDVGQAEGRLDGGEGGEG